MAADRGRSDRATRLAETRYKYSFRGRLERYCAGRIRILPIRLAYEGAGSALVAVLGNWQLGLLALASCFAGEALEFASVAWARARGRIRRRPRAAGRIVTVGSVAWATGMSGGVAALWAIGGIAYWFLAFVFLYAALVNAQLVGGLHPPSLAVKRLILGATGLALFVDAYRGGGAIADIEVFGIGVLVMVLTLWGLFVRIQLQNHRRHEAERGLIEAQLELEARNADLKKSKERLREHAQKAESLAFDSQAANRAKSRFLATMSREIQAPMTAIIDTAAGLQRDGLTEGQAAGLGTIRRGAESLLTIVSDILDLTDAETGKLQVARAPFSLRMLWTDTVAFAERQAADKGVSFAARAGIGDSVELLGDNARIRQILINLVTNAIRATDRGEVTLQLTTRRVGRELSLCFSVTDNGPGIPRNILARLFDGLGEGDGGTIPAAGGAGLGLSVSRRLARLMGGDLRAQSELGKGSTFTLILPLALAGEAAPDVPRAGSDLSPDLSGRHVLILDDSEDSTRQLERMLKATGAETSAARPGEPILERVYDLSPDVILMDVPEPLEEGLKTAAAIREAEASAGRGRCVIVALTDTALKDDRRRCLEAGADAVVIRPVTRARLFAALRPLDTAAQPREPAAP